MKQVLWTCGCGFDDDGTPTRCAGHTVKMPEACQSNAEPILCPNIETCQELHNETEHHYGCECSDCMYEYWLLKR